MARVRETVPAATADRSLHELLEELTTLTGRMQATLEEIPVDDVRVFGSAARGDTDQTSDVDLLVEMEPGRSLLDLVALWQDLEDLLGTRVDLVSAGS